MTEAPQTDAVGPVVERLSVAAARRSGGMFGYAVIAMVGVGVFGGLTLSRGRSAGDDGLIALAKAATTTRFVTPEPLPGDASASMSVVPGSGVAVPAPQFSTDNSGVTPVAMVMPTTAASATGPVPAGAIVVANRLSAPALVVDLGETAGATSNAIKPLLGNPALVSVPTKPGDPNDTDQFVQHASARADVARASRIGRLDFVIAEGTIIGAALETALNSDLPGFARAVISRDIMSFDGTQVLIPRGSRVIGQYKSGVAMGASRVFVIWTRLIRPDGVSIQLASPGGDDLGRGGIGGKVDRHFLQRFGGSLLMSVVNGAINAGVAAVGKGLPVYINSVAEAGQAASSAMRSGDIPPTITAQQGIAIKIFVAHDLDFSGLDPAS